MCAALGHGSKLFRESQVVARRKAGCAQWCFDHHEFIARRHQLGLAAVTEDVDLAVDRGYFAQRIEEHARIEVLTGIGHFRKRSPVQPHTMVARDFRHSSNQRAVEGLSMRTCAI